MVRCTWNRATLRGTHENRRLPPLKVKARLTAKVQCTMRYRMGTVQDRAAPFPTYRNTTLKYRRCRKDKVFRKMINARCARPSRAFSRDGAYLSYISLSFRLGKCFLTFFGQNVVMLCIQGTSKKLWNKNCYKESTTTLKKCYFQFLVVPYFAPKLHALGVYHTLKTEKENSANFYIW